jgi:hypothetical protein
VPADRDHVLVFGCPRLRRTFKALVDGAAPHAPASPSLTITDCPGCGEEHVVLDLYGRPRRLGEAVDVEVQRPVAAAIEDRSSAARRVTTEAILAAVGAEDAPAAEIAAKVGYSGHARGGALLRRIGRSASLQRQIVVTPPSRRGEPTRLRRRSA